MTFPASTITTSEAWDSIRKQAVRLKAYVQNMRDKTATGDVERQRFIDLQRFLDSSVDTWDSLTATPGLQAYVRDQVDNQTLDVAAEYLAMRTAAIALRDWIFAAIPTDAGSGAALLFIVDSEGNQQDIMVTTAQSATFRTEADTLLATIA